MASTIKSDNGVSSGVTGIVQTADSSGQLAFQTTTSGGSAVTALTIDNSQNVGIGVTPSAWSQGKVVEVGSLGNAFWGYSANQNFITQNAYYNGSAWKYTGTNAATYYTQGSGAHYWYAAPSGTAGNTATFNGLMTLNNSGTLVFAQSGQGIQFTNSSATTNSTLNDYETGTWTVTDQSGAGLTFTNATAQYTKIGNMVFFSIDLNFPSTSNSSNVALSLPFTSFNTGGSNPGGGAQTYNPAGTYTWGVGSNQAFIRPYTSSGVAATNIAFSGKEIGVTGVYKASF